MPLEQEEQQHGARGSVDGGESLARRSGFSEDAVEAMRRSVVRGGGRMAQFDHREFGGLGQWMQGGMSMISDPSDHDLKQRIDRLCDALARAIACEPARSTPTPTGTRSTSGSQSQYQTVGTAGFGRRIDQPTWYPASFGTPSTSGSQNDLRYAWFAAKRRLAVDRHGVMTLYDTGDHRIGGVSQQQGAASRLSFVSQHGDIDLDRLPVVDHGDDIDARVEIAEPSDETSPIPHRPTLASTIDPFVALERLADLHARGIVDDQEFARKKSELLDRI